MPEVLIVCRANRALPGRRRLVPLLRPGLLYVVSAGVAPLSHVLEEVTAVLPRTGVPHGYPEEVLPGCWTWPDRGHRRRVGEKLPARTVSRDRHHWSDIPQIEGCAYSGHARRSGEDRRQVRDTLARWMPDLELGDPVMSRPRPGVTPRVRLSSVAAVGTRSNVRVTACFQRSNSHSRSPATCPAPSVCPPAQLVPGASFPETDRQTRRVSRAQRRGLDDLRPHDGNAEQV